MKPVVWMVAASVASWLAVLPFVDARTRIEILLGMSAPLAVASGTWVLAERTHRRNPQALTSLMIAAFAFKFVFFGAYMAAMLGLWSLNPVPFVASFVGYFIALHLTEALLLGRLFAAGRELAATGGGRGARPEK